MIRKDSLQNENDIFTKNKNVIHFNNNGFKNPIKLGYANFIEANIPIDLHIHPNSMEVTFMLSGEQTHVINEKEYSIKGGDILVSYPNEKHSSSNYLENPSKFFYLVFTINENQPFSLLPSKESINLLNSLKALNRSFHGSEKLQFLFQNILSTYIKKDNQLKKIKLHTLITEALLELISLSEKKPEKISKDINDSMIYINSNIQKKITLNELSLISNLSLSHFKQKFRKQIGTTPNNYITDRKIILAKDKLENSDLPITKIAYDLGFSSSQYFSYIFKKRTRQTPSQFRQKHDET